jgi:hypothetical protein
MMRPKRTRTVPAWMLLALVTIAVPACPSTWTPSGLGVGVKVNPGAVLCACIMYGESLMKISVDVKVNPGAVLCACIMYGESLM